MPETAPPRLPPDLAIVHHRPGKVQVVASRAAQIAKLERRIAAKHPKSVLYAAQLAALKEAEEEAQVAAAAAEAAVAAHRAAKKG